MPPRAATAGELTKFRSDKQASLLYLGFLKPNTIYTAHLATPLPTSLDMNGQINYDTGSGTLGNIHVGMRMDVGTTAGGSELGWCRIRKTPTASIFYIDEESYINWNAGGTIYLTIVDDFPLTARHIKITSGNIPKLDFEVTYSDQHTNFDPTPVLGPDRVLWLTGATVSITWPDISTDSYVVDGSSLASVLWSCPGASATSGLTTYTPQFTFNAAGQYVVYCQLTATNGAVFEACRRIWVFDAAHPPETQFRLRGNPRGDMDAGGWTFEVELFANADRTTVQDRTKVVLFSKDYYDGVEGSIGEYSTAENIIAEGWISGETIDWNPQKGGAVSFTVTGPAEWLKSIPGFPVGLENVSTTPAAWTSMKNLTVRLFLWHMLHWRTTLTKILDMRLTSDTRQLRAQDNLQPMLWNQLTDVAVNTIYAMPWCDRYGMFYCLIDGPMVPVASRSGFPTVMTLTTADWKDSITVDRYTRSQVSRVELSGVVVQNGVEDSALFSLAPGHVFKPYGQPINEDYKLLASQSQANELAGLKLAYEDRPFELDIELAMNNRLIDISSRQYLAISIGASDTVRGLVYSGNIIPRSVEIAYDDRGKPTVRLHCIPETSPDLSQNGDIPPGAEEIPGTPGIPPIPGIPPLPPIDILPDPVSQTYAVALIKTYGVYYTKDLGEDSHWFAMNSGLPASYDSLFALQVTRSGALYVQYQNGSDSRVYYASGVGESWSVCFDPNQVGRPEYHFNPEPLGFAANWNVNAMGVYPDEQDNVLIIAGFAWGIGGTAGKAYYPWVGNGSGFSLATSVHLAEIGSTVDILGSLAFTGDSTWIWVFEQGPGLGALRHTVLSYSGTGPSSSANSGAADFGDGVQQSRNPTACEGHVIKGSTLINMPYGTDDGGVTFTLFAGPSGVTLYAEAGQFFESLACNLDGDKILVGVGDVLGLRRSSDYGATWAATAVAGSVMAIYFMGTDGALPPDTPTETWIVAKEGDIGITSDFGNTFTDVTGDLYTWCTVLFRVRMIRTFIPPTA